MPHNAARAPPGLCVLIGWQCVEETHPTEILKVGSSLKQDGRDLIEAVPGCDVKSRIPSIVNRRIGDSSNASSSRPFSAVVLNVAESKQDKYSYIFLCCTEHGSSDRTVYNAVH
uniref:Uncharacterized protein n=1 Tax=Timema genevievae TaxID=629358 RepID=A0A7R9JNX6_TIMGE|nr:unnamed protein product [Timema genevievae]